MTRTGASTLILFAFALALGGGGWGCARQEHTDSVNGSKADSTTSGPGGAPSAATGVFAEGQDTTGSAPPDTSSPVGGTLADLRGRLRDEALRLDRAVRAGKLDEVSSRALHVGDLAVALGGKSTGLPNAKVQQIEGDVSETLQIVESLRAKAAAADAGGVKAQNAVLQGVVARIVAASAPGA